MSTTLTLKNVPDEIYERLKASAQANRRSLNSEAIVCLERVLAPVRRSSAERIERARALRALGTPRLRADEIDSAEILGLVRDSDCSAYDCEFVALAARLGTRLATMDRQLLRAFPSLAFAPEPHSGIA